MNHNKNENLAPWYFTHYDTDELYSYQRPCTSFCAFECQYHCRLSATLDVRYLRLYSIQTDWQRLSCRCRVRTINGTACLWNRGLIYGPDYYLPLWFVFQFPAMICENTSRLQSRKHLLHSHKTALASITCVTPHGVHSWSTTGFGWNANFEIKLYIELAFARSSARVLTRYKVPTFYVSSNPGRAKIDFSIRKKCLRLKRA